MRKIAGQVVGSRHGVGEGVQVRLLVLLICEEEEALILPVIDFWNADRAAQGAAEIVSTVAGPQLSAISARPAAADGERAAGIQIFIDEIVKTRAVILVGAGLH